MEYSILNTIDSPLDLKKLDFKSLPILADELRQFLIHNLSKNGGHFAANLGTVELTIALHYIYNTPTDNLIWDVGHQAYCHKILTGRRQHFETNRKFGGLSGFPKRSESLYDAFGVGHSSTSISAILGMAIATKNINESIKNIAVIGDGAMTAGMAFEAMNHLGYTDLDVLIILNDNCMSIDPNVGALKNYLTSITTSGTYNKLKDDLWHLLEKLPAGKSFTQDKFARLTHLIKGLMLKQSNLFESLNIRYFGPIDGHDLAKLITTLEQLKKIPGPKLLHIITTKGKGFVKAELDQTKWHAPGLFDKITGEILVKKKALELKKYQDVFGLTLVELAELNQLIYGITPAMPSGSSLKFMMERFPERSFDVGICEQHAVTLSAGMVAKGLKVYCNIYSSFMQRAYDQVVHDVAIQNLPVIFCLDRAGLVGEDGPTHHGCYDLAYFRCIPNLIISAPLNEHELRNLMFTAQLPHIKNPFVIRYPRGEGVLENWQNNFQEIEIGKGQFLKQGIELIIITIGHIGNLVKEVLINLPEKYNPAHFDLRFLKPIDSENLLKICQKYKKIITVEDGCISGGMGSTILEFMADNGFSEIQLKRIGLPDKVIEHGTIEELQASIGMSKTMIFEKIINFYDE